MFYYVFNLDLRFLNLGLTKTNIYKPGSKIFCDSGCSVINKPLLFKPIALNNRVRHNKTWINVVHKNVIQGRN